MTQDETEVGPAQGSELGCPGQESAWDWGDGTAASPADKECAGSEGPREAPACPDLWLHGGE